MSFFARDFGVPAGVVVVHAPHGVAEERWIAGVHVRLVVVADVQDVLVALGRARQRLEADVERAAVAGPRHHGGLGVAVQSSAAWIPEASPPRSRTRSVDGHAEGDDRVTPAMIVQQHAGSETILVGLRRREPAEHMPDGDRGAAARRGSRRAGDPLLGDDLVS